MVAFSSPQPDPKVAPDLLERVVIYDPEAMRERGRLGGIATHARHGSARSLSAARAALECRFVHLADPGGTLSPDERARRVAALRREHFTHLGQLSAAARRARKAMREGEQA